MQMGPHFRLTTSTHFPALQGADSEPRIESFVPIRAAHVSVGLSARLEITSIPMDSGHSGCDDFHFVLKIPRNVEKRRISSQKNLRNTVFLRTQPSTSVTKLGEGLGSNEALVVKLKRNNYQLCRALSPPPIMVCSGDIHYCLHLAVTLSA